jgi:hypothetical protein
MGVVCDALRVVTAPIPSWFNCDVRLALSNSGGGDPGAGGGDGGGDPGAGGGDGGGDPGAGGGSAGVSGC